ncbi:MAG: FAD-dependent oxidoreductase [Chloroflexi bacterium]|nr:FAD-dependent oxidoreductase [Chloroflexota bacterium]
MIRLETRVVVIGGGATGTAVLRDLAMRGVEAVLVERGNLAEGTSGNFHGLLHSGGRYAVKDPPAAEECIHENAILRRIAPQAIEDTGGFFVVLTDEDEAFLPRFLEGCRQVGIPTEVLSGSQALQEEPALSPQVRYAVTVPDASIDGWTLCIGSVKAAKEYGAKVFLYTPVTKILRQGDRVVGIEAVDRSSGNEYEIRAEYVINATGPWTTKTARLAGLEVPMALDYGTMVVLNGRPVRRAINRCRPPTDGDIVVPVGTAIVLGTTSVPIQDPDDFCIQEWEIDLLLEEAIKMVPVVEEMGVQRYYAAVRPLYKPPTEGAEGQREVSRAFYVLDHEELDGLGGLITITGGKVTTCRLMAEKTVDLVCAKMGIQAPCRTHLEPLPPA